MKKFLSLIMVAAMLVAVFAMVGCKDDPVETTDTTTEATTTTTASTPVETTTTTPAPTETTTTTPAPTETTTTTPAPTETTTTTPAPTETTTTTPPPSTTGSTVSVFARFDFGKNTKAEAEGKTSHAYLTSILSYNTAKVAVEYEDDSIVVYAKANATADDGRTDFSLNFEDIVTFDFDDELMNGFGGYNNAPLSPGSNWIGRHQFVKVRMRNFTENNVMSIWYSRAGHGGQWYTTTVCSHMFLQGGPAAITAEIDNSWKTYTYDMVFQNCLTRSIVQTDPSDFPDDDVAEAIEYIKNRGSYTISNWGPNDTITGLRFAVLGAYDPAELSDTRTAIKMGAKVEIDYIVFGSSIDQLAEYTSYIEDESNKA